MRVFHMSKKDSIEQRFEQLLIPIADQAGVSVYDVEYVKEAGEYFLRAYIDKEGGVSIDDCEAVSRALDKPLDKEDFIPDAYTLEVSSPGLGRRLTKDRHLEKSLGMEIDLKLFKPLDGEKEFTGSLKGYSEKEVILLCGEAEKAFSREQIADLRLHLEL